MKPAKNKTCPNKSNPHNPTEEKFPVSPGFNDNIVPLELIIKIAIKNININAALAAKQSLDNEFAIIVSPVITAKFASIIKKDILE